jgi:hypothetical protein
MNQKGTDKEGIRVHIRRLLGLWRFEKQLNRQKSEHDISLPTCLYVHQRITGLGYSYRS